MNNKGQVPWNKGKTGVYSSETLKSMSRAKRGFVPWSKGRKFSESHKQNISKSKSGENNWWFGKHHSKTTKKKMSNSAKGSQHFLGKKHTQETKRKMRESALGKGCPRYNPIACQKIEEYGKKYGYHFQHALNGGEVRVIGYALDGYDKKKNTAIEYYERWHKNTKRRDAQRKREIIGYLGCKFIELREEV